MKRITLEEELANVRPLRAKVFIYGVDEFPTKASNVLKDPSSFYELSFEELPISKAAYLSADGVLVKGSYEPLENLQSKTEAKVMGLSDEDLEQLKRSTLVFLDANIGRHRRPKRKQLNIGVNSLVRSKTDPRLGKGVIISITDQIAMVKFIHAQKLYGKDVLAFHTATLAPLGNTTAALALLKNARKKEL